jgi:hypothetical protein
MEKKKESTKKKRKKQQQRIYKIQYKKKIKINGYN